MLLETKVRTTRKDSEDKEVTEYVTSLLNLDRVQSVFPSGVNGVLIVFMTDKTQHLVKDDYKKFLKASKQ